MKSIIAVVSLLLCLVSTAEARKWTENVKFGNSTIVMDINEEEEGIKIWNVTISVLNGKNEKISMMKYDQVYFKYSVEKTKSNKKYFVFQAFCSGTGCNDGANWGIINNWGEFILVPYDNNLKWKEQILNEN